MYFIYILIDPRDDSVRYVGMTNDVYARFSQHLRCDSSNITKNVWVTELKSLNMMVIMRTIEIVETVEEARKREIYWMQHYASAGAYLLNTAGAKSITFDDFMSFFKPGANGQVDINDDELPQEEIAFSSKRIHKNVVYPARNLFTYDEQVMHAYPLLAAEYDAGVRSLSIEEIAKVTGHPSQLVNARKRNGSLIQTKRKGFYSMASIINWLKLEKLPVAR